MKFINLASNKSAWRGYEYYTENRVNYHISCGNSEYRGKVSGNGRTYDVHINIEHPRSSSCNCPHAEGKRIVCKHMVALYFSIFPDVAKEYISLVEEAEREEEKYWDEIEERLIKKINKMTKSDLQNALYSLLMDGPEWQFERFVSEYVE